MKYTKDLDDFSVFRVIFPALEDARIEPRKVAMPALSSSRMPYYCNADLKSMRAAAQVVSAVMGREERRYCRRGERWGPSRPYIKFLT